ncbi:helix-turn-helix domain-containing protein [Angustibacter luteus]|uniref:Helix-turn-helix domain-containing protein n=1 Tax=Angustibacter luteus TaxID=658456 RepID=A0ABW1JCQ4_9ACTN
MDPHAPGAPDAPSLVLRQARERAMLTQRELAVRAGVSQSVVSRLETGARPTSWTVFTLLLGALDLQPRIALEPLESHVSRMLELEQSRPALDWFDDLVFDQRAVAMLPSLVPVVVDGTLGARLHGLPLPVGDIEFLVPPSLDAAELAAACRASVISLRAGPDERTVVAERESRRLVFRTVAEPPAATLVTPPWAGTFPGDVFDDGAPVRVVPVGSLRLTNDEQRFLRHALSRAPRRE